MIIIFFHVLFVLNTYLLKRSERKNKMSVNCDKLLVSTRSIQENQEEKNETKTKFDIENSFYSDNNYQIRFNPPLYIQRYCAVQKILSDENLKGKLRKVVEFGCSELSFFLYLKNTPHLEELLFVDIDRAILEQNKRKIEALSADFLHLRERPLKVFVYEGSVSSKDRRLEHVDAVVAIELIEHLYPETLSQVPEVIFGFIRPQVAVLTTPNADFNVLFPNFSGSRHPDHKFEWTRSQFQSWCSQIIHKYPDYLVTYQGVGEGPKGSENLGCCSQMAIFHRKSTGDLLQDQGQDLEDTYQLVAQEIYPMHVDNRSDEDKILDEAAYYIRSFHLNNDEEEMPLEKLASIMETKIETLKDALENAGWEVVQRDLGSWYVVCRPLSLVSEYDADENFDWDMDIEGDDAEEHGTGVRNDLTDDSDGLESSPGSRNGLTGDLPPGQRFADDWRLGPSRKSIWKDAPGLKTRVTDDSAPGPADESKWEGGPSQKKRFADDWRLGPNYKNDWRTDLGAEIGFADDLAHGTTGTGDWKPGPGPRCDWQPIPGPVPVSKSQPQDSSICSMFYEAPTPENTLTCPDISNPEFQFDSSIQESMDQVPKSPIRASTPQKDQDHKLNLDFETPSSSWTPEIVDSGYPNTSSVPDTPESDLPSIDEDLDDQPVEQIPRVPGFQVQFQAQVENGDLANNNRDREGNNVAVREDIIIRERDRDIENENDIY
ncbi:uncharacterized protein LOC103574275 [Microplitis demolitor]|uniref:uncharacterized protein LOC103574275 n=1 Tax=Microplitis demolitor TaxID=69319 RepID=UPI00235B5D66|nr:uncharacterized protein LOC103574275 [Microplitis demolitor]